MNQRGDFFMNIMVFLGALLILGLYANDFEPIMVQQLSTSEAGAPGTDVYSIVIASSAMILFYAIYALTKKSNSFTFG